MFKTHKVVMLSTNEKAILNISNVHNRKSNILTYNEIIPDDINHTAYNLYIISDDKPTKNDWCINNNMDTVYQLSNSGNYNGWNKIIATTDKLKIKVTCNCSETEAINCGKPKAIGKCQQLIPQIPKHFIDYYITEYNKGNIITKVEVEYIIGKINIFIETIPTNQGSLIWFNELGEYELLKLIPDNCVCLKPLKTTWSKDEVKQLCWEAYTDHVQPMSPTAIEKVLMPKFNEWFNKHIN